MWFQNTVLLTPESQPLEQECNFYVTFGKPPSTQVTSLESSSTFSDNSSSEEKAAPSQGPLRFMDTRVKIARELEEHGFLTTGSGSIDSFLHGGIPCFGITEIYGDSASAKTQLCLQLALLAHLPLQLGGLNSDTVYINTEGCGFPHKRMVELAGHFSQKFDYHKRNPMDNVIVEIALDHESLFTCLFQKIPKFIKDGSKIRLIIVDSIAAVYRADYNNDDEGMTERTYDLRRIGKLLHYLSWSLKAAIVVVNQVTASISSGCSIPSLGLVWENFVTTRLHLVRRNNDRFIKVIHAPHIPPGSIKIRLSQDGISSDSRATQET